MAKGTKHQSSPSSSSSSFRSVLPHEPIPNEQYNGYLLLQGSFQVQPKTTNKNKPKEKNDTSASILSNDELKQYLWNVFAQSETNIQHIQPPHQCISIEILGQSSTKIQLLYKNSLEARYVFHYLRYHSFSPFHVLQPQIPQIPQMKMKDAEEYHISKKAMQITQIIPRTYDTYENRDRIEHWPRVSPPKFRRLILDSENSKHSTSLKLKQQRDQTRYLYCTGIIPQSLLTSSQWNALPKYTHPIIIFNIIRSIFTPFDTSKHGIEVWLQTNSKKKNIDPNYNTIYIGMRSHEDALRLLTLENTIQDITLGDANADATFKTERLFLDWADTITPSSFIKQEIKIKGEPSKSECTSLTKDVFVPGLTLIENYISAEEECQLLAILASGDAPWSPKQTRPSGGSVKRRVQHYGYIFDYVSSDVIRDPTDFIPPPLPSLNQTDNECECECECEWNTFANVIDRLRSYSSGCDQERPFGDVNQITLNEYLPGQGIGSHVDTPNAFTNGLASLSLSSGCVMEFKFQDARKLLYLPPRSLLVMRDEARYKYAHAITGRMTDTHNGEVLQRHTRYSLTFRTALHLDAKTILPYHTSSQFPLQWSFGNQQQEDHLQTPHCEKYHVHKVYDAIATQWNHTRGKRGVLWPCVVQFLQSLPKHSIVGDVGCGDGKYFSSEHEEKYDNEILFLGCDISLPLLQTIPQKTRQTYNVIVADCISLPFHNEVCDATICIAVFHHISTYKRRIHVIQELKRITKKGGYIHIQAWAKEQQLSKSNLDQVEGKKLNKHDSLKTEFRNSDVFVPFHVQPKYLNKVSSDEKHSTIAQKYAKAYKGAEYNEMKNLVVFQRYCHMYTNHELDSLIADVGGLRICESGYEAGNYFVVVERIE